MLLEEAIKITRGAIDHVYEGSEADNVSRYYFEDAMGLTNLSSELSPSQIKMWEVDQQRLASGEPLQYVAGVAHFYGHMFLVNKDVLIPRPETEELVRHCVQLLKTYDRPVSVLDIGSGSGCIPISIKLERPSTTMVTSIDISRPALTVAIDNSQALDAHVLFKESDILDFNACKCLDTYDIIISNPPYIPTKEKELMPSWVTDHEPEIALFVEDDNPLEFYNRIMEFSQEHLASDGFLLFEINENNASEVLALARTKFPSGEIDLLSDLQGKDRIITISI